MNKPYNSVLDSILNELRGLIRKNEGQFADDVLADLDDALQRSHNIYKTAYRWMRIYRNLKG